MFEYFMSVTPAISFLASNRKEKHKKRPPLKNEKATATHFSCF